MDINKFYERMKQILGEDEYEKFYSSLVCSHKKGLAFNSKKMQRENFLNNFEYSLKPLDLGEDNFVVKTEDKMGGHILHHAGAFYMQEPSAMIAGFKLPLKKGYKVLDACAAPGGKTFQISKRLDGVLVSNEIELDRARILNSNVERLGLSNVIITNMSPEELGNSYVDKFDCVLVDAPCSGEGMFRKEDQAIAQWSQDYVELCAKRQKDILTNVDKVLKENGYLMYSTCTYSVEENEQVVAFLVDLGYQIIDLGEIDGSSSGIKIDGYNTHLSKRFYPHISNGEGQFVCLLKKEKENNGFMPKPKPHKEVGRTELRILKEFFENNLSLGFYESIKDCLLQRGDAFYYCKDKSLVTNDKKTLSLGVKLGVIIKNRFEPSHNLFTAFSSYFIRKVELTAKQAEDYIKGNTVLLDCDNGWCAVNYLGCCVGGGKMVNGVLKNHYPKGLRLINAKNQ